MDFPEDIWSEILGYFHSPYKCPSHYKAIDELLGLHPNTGWQNVSKIYDSYYLYTISVSWTYWSVPDIQHLIVPPDLNMRRNVATGTVKDDFIQIWNTYASKYPYHRTLPHIHYDN